MHATCTVYHLRLRALWLSPIAFITRSQRQLPRHGAISRHPLATRLPVLAGRVLN